ncbi:uncharacterized protein LOC110243237 [Exaiptasia diaphana]|uniref:Transmembrane protein n=1 Tax=Exaiptasia diaphana TaxID=2652724 RepID=A0A913XIS0_EXADI|nr:uncharacterized protein LOC110243237 [Exaiptasia diaphana]KXJ20303.1 hypothetical protein AC249_AIPGENE28604 [Exaiptasia diaphana]
MAEPVTGLPTKEQEKEMKEMRSCQRMAGWYGLCSTVLVGAVSFGGLTFAPRSTVPKMYIPMLSLGSAACCGWVVSVWFTRSCRTKQLVNVHSKNISVDGHPARQTKQSDKSGKLHASNKFGDQSFFKDEK